MFAVARHDIAAAATLAAAAAEAQRKPPLAMLFADADMSPCRY